MPAGWSAYISASMNSLLAVLVEDIAAVGNESRPGWCAAPAPEEEGPALMSPLDGGSGGPPPESAPQPVTLLTEDPWPGRLIVDAELGFASQMPTVLPLTASRRSGPNRLGCVRPRAGPHGFGLQ
jgi:hypothetical protein